MVVYLENGIYKAMITLYNITENTNVEFICMIRPQYEPLCIKAIEDCSLCMQYTNSATFTYTLDGNFTNGIDITANQEIALHADDEVHIWAKNTISVIRCGNSTLSDTTQPLFKIYNTYGNAEYKVSGNLISLLRPFGNNYSTSVLTTSNINGLTNIFCNTKLIDAAGLIMPSNTVKNCFGSIFKNTPITISPVLKAETLSEGCYSYMFEDCSLLNSIYCSFKDWYGSESTTDTRVSATYHWVNNVPSGGTFYKHPQLIVPHSMIGSINAVPAGWTVTNIE
jgi:hypothetical protein